MGTTIEGHGQVVVLNTLMPEFQDSFIAHHVLSLLSWNLKIPFVWPNENACAPLACLETPAPPQQ